MIAQEIAEELIRSGVPADQIERLRAKDDAQDLYSIISVGFEAIGGFLTTEMLIDLAKELGKDALKGVAQAVFQRVLNKIYSAVRKWGRPAKIELPSGEPVILGEEYKLPPGTRTPADARTLADLKTMGLVLIGSSTFPHYSAEQKLDNPAFKRSAELAKKVLSSKHTIFPNVEVLDLFDQDLNPVAIIDRIEDHVRRHPDMHDVMLYYCGHGSFLKDREHSYFLTLKGTRPDREAMTGLPVKSFHNMIEANGLLTSRRCTFIVDACFAGAAIGAFSQNMGLDALVVQQMHDMLPSEGFAFLTATGQHQLAKGIGGYGETTMFTGALAEVLMADTGAVTSLTLGALCAKMAARIRRHPDIGLPQCHAPEQTDGDISRIPIFLAGNTDLLKPTITFLKKAAEPARAAEPPKQSSDATSQMEPALDTDWQLRDLPGLGASLTPVVQAVQEKRLEPSIQMNPSGPAAAQKKNCGGERRTVQPVSQAGQSTKAGQTLVEEIERQQTPARERGDAQQAEENRRAQAEAQAWELVLSKRDAKLVEDFLERFPCSKHESSAKKRLGILTKIKERDTKRNRATSKALPIILGVMLLITCAIIAFVDNTPVTRPDVIMVMAPIMFFVGYSFIAFVLISAIIYKIYSKKDLENELASQERSRGIDTPSGAK